jgi:hypothetical protein
MNNQINFLVDKTAELIPGVCTLEYESGNKGVEFSEDALEKFVELIVRECADELLKWKDEPFPFDEDLAVRLIKDHFGVK